MQTSLTHTFLVVPRYALVPRGQSPGVSVGHTCTFIPSDEGEKGKIVIVGGANPNGSFSECSVIDLGEISHSENAVLCQNACSPHSLLSHCLRSYCLLSCCRAEIHFLKAEVRIAGTCCINNLF